jgi:hypothetical protein
MVTQPPAEDRFLFFGVHRMYPYSMEIVIAARIFLQEKSTFYVEMTYGAEQRKSRVLPHNFRDACVAGQFDLRDTALIFRRADFARNRATDFFKAGKVPEVRKVAALLRLHGLHGAVVALHENASTVRLFLQGHAATISAQPRKLLDEFVFADAFERGEPGDFRIRQTHLPWPTAAGRATLTFEENWHANQLCDYAILIPLCHKSK